MTLPNLSWMVNVGELRYIQARCEIPPRRNPDVLAGAFLPLARRIACLLHGTLLMPRLRARPFYNYLLARTKYYDQVFLDAVAAGAGCIINIGCGGDTRAYRFAPLLRRNGVRVLECDQPRAIRAKRRIAESRWPTEHVRYVELDLETGGWTALAPHLAAARAPVLVMLEGVSPYIGTAAFEAFLRFLATTLSPASTLAYDFKIVDTEEEPGRRAPVERPFRLPPQRPAVAAYHAALGLELRHMELSHELARRLVPGATVLFHRDGLLTLRPRAQESE
jgi:methyltransferase (TIGR00027 family)